MIQITNVRVFPIKDSSSKTKAYANITLSNQFVVTDFKVIQGTKGLFVGFPSKKSGDEYKNTSYALDDDTRNYIQSFILEEYNNPSQNPSSSSDNPF